MLRSAHLGKQVYTFAEKDVHMLKNEYAHMNEKLHTPSENEKIHAPAETGTHL